MSFRLLVTLTVVEIVALVVVLAIYLIVIARQLRSISANLAKVTFGVRAVEQQCLTIEPAVTKVNQTLTEMAGVLPSLAQKAERLAAGR